VTISVQTLRQSMSHGPTGVYWVLSGSSSIEGSKDINNSIDANTSTLAHYQD
jgi:hypothetical protein